MLRRLDPGFVSFRNPGYRCNTEFAQIRAYTSDDRFLFVYGAQAACPGQAWTYMISFDYWLRSCESDTWFDGRAVDCTARH